MGKINLDLSQITGALKKLSFLRSYSMLLLPVVIIFAAAVVFTAALLMGRSFKEKVTKQSVPIGRDLDSRLNNAIPSGQVEVERRYQQEFGRDANQIERMAIESTRRELLSYGIFPEPNEPTPALWKGFASRFDEGIDGRIRQLNGGDCPTEEEIRTRTAGTTGTPKTASGKTDAERISEELIQQRARAISIYVNPADISGYTFWEEYQFSKVEDAVMDCWFWQLGYWIIEDVLDTGGKMNAGSGNVFVSPVKRIVYIGFVAPDKITRGQSGVTSKGAQDRPKYVKKPEDMLAEPCTGRLSNADIDVVHFSVAVVVGTDAILPFMKELCSAKEHRFAGFNGQEPVKVYKHNQITILQSSIRPATMSDARHKRYRYGNNAVELEVVCEYIFNKKGYQEINPETSGKKPEEATTAQQ